MLNGLADRRDFDSITKRINGGITGRANRDQYFGRAQRVLNNSVGLPATGRFLNGTGAPAGAGNAGTVGHVDANRPHLRALAQAKEIVEACADAAKGDCLCGFEYHPHNH